MHEQRAVSTTARGQPVTTPNGPAPTEERLPDGQHADHWVLTPEERAKGFIRPVRKSYRHEACGTVTSMGTAIAETYARDPAFYGLTYCAGCQDYYPVGEKGEFTWLDERGNNTGQRVGT